MAFPSLRSTATTGGSTTAVSPGISITLPTRTSGDLLFVMFGQDGGNGTITHNGTGWTTLIEGSSSVGGAGEGVAIRFCLYARICTNDANDNITVTGDNNDYTYISFAVQDHGVSNIATDTTLAVGTETSTQNPDPPNCNPGVSKDFLWIEGFHSDDDDNTTTYWSTDFTAIAQIESAQSASSCMSALAYRQFTGSSLNPGTMAMAAAEESFAFTLAIPPVSATVVERSDTDKLFLLDLRTSDASKLVHDKAFMRSAGMRDLDKLQPTDKTFLSDQVLPSRERTRIEADKTYLNDSAVRLREFNGLIDRLYMKDTLVIGGILSRTAVDKLLALDYPMRDISKRTRFNLLLNHPFEEEKDGPQNMERTRLERDPTLLASKVSKGLDKVAQDKLLSDTPAARKELEKRATDKVFAVDPQGLWERAYFAPTEMLFLKEIVAAEYEAGPAGPVTRAVTDYLFLSGQIFRVVEKIQRDMTFVSDSLWKGLDKLARDFLLIGDRVLSKERLLAVMDRLFVVDLRVGDLGRSATDKLYVSDRRYAALEKMLREGLYLQDARFSALDRRALDSLLLGDSSYTAREKIQIFREGLYLRDERFNAFDKRAPDNLLLSDSGYAALEKIRVFLEGLYLRDERFNALAKEALDKLLLGDKNFAAVERILIILERLYLQDARLSDLDRNALDKLLLGDSAIGDPPFGGPILRAAIDQLFLLDRMTKVLDKGQLTDRLLLGDAGMRTLDKDKITDKVLLGDTAQKGRDNYAQDKALLKEVTYKTTERVMRDSPLLSDWRFSERLLRSLDSLFLSDSALAAKSAGIDLTFTDKLFIYDSRASVLDKALIEKVMLASFVIRGVDRYRTDGALLGERVSKALEKRVTDFLFLLDTLLIAASGVREVSATDKLLIGDAGYREILKSVLEKLLLFDWATVERGAKTVFASDSLLLNEARVSELLKLVRESVLLQDVGVRERLAQVPALDKVLLSDAAQREHDRNLMDPVALNDLARKILEVALREGLFLADSGAGQWFPSIIEFLVWARLRVVEFLGVTTSRRDPLGRKIAAVDLLGRKYDAVQSRINT